MCVTIELSPARIALPWDSDRKTVTVPIGLDVEHTTLVVRAVLTELAVPQPASGAVCWCGEPIDIKGEVIGDAA